MAIDILYCLHIIFLLEFRDTDVSTSFFLLYSLRQGQANLFPGATFSGAIDRWATC